MPNVLLTQRCVRSCPYCFARKHMSDSAPDDILSWPDLIYLADFFERSGEKRMSILGGEPTLHPAFNDFLVYLLERGFSLNVFTAGIMPGRLLEEANRLFSHLPIERLAFVCNINDPEKTRSSLSELECLKQFLQTFGLRVIPGFNIYRTDFELDFLFQYINEYGLNRSLRLGIAHPIPGTRNRHVALDDFDHVLNRLFAYAPVFDRFRVKPGLDCGFPMCRLTNEQLGWLYRSNGGHYDFGCNPVLDIGPDMMVWSCFPLSEYQKRSVYEFDDIGQIHEHFARLHRSVRMEQAGIYDECDACTHQEDRLCMGGCLAHSLEHFRTEHPLRVAEVYS